MGKYRELRERTMSPESRQRADLRGRELMAEYLLSELRDVMGLSQKELAAMVGIAPPTLCKIEKQHDLQVSTLIRLVEAMGGELEIVASFPTGRLRINPLGESVQTKEQAAAESPTKNTAGRSKKAGQTKRKKAAGSAQR